MGTTPELSEKHAEWIETRGIPVEVAVEAGLYSIGSALAFPYTRNGETVFVKLRRPQKQFSLDRTGAKLCLWNLDQMRESS